jgi:3-oxoacyl-[acyl-carrier-protein] synthase-3
MDPFAHRHRATAHCADDQTTADLAEQAARQAMAAAGVTAADIDFVVVGTTTPDFVFPNVGCLLQERLGIRGCPAFSVEAACSGFIYALSIADRFRCRRAGEVRAGYWRGNPVAHHRLGRPHHLCAVR